jgi:hypothetical protein
MSNRMLNLTCADLCHRVHGGEVPDVFTSGKHGINPTPRARTVEFSVRLSKHTVVPHGRQRDGSVSGPFSEEFRNQKKLSFDELCRSCIPIESGWHCAGKKILIMKPTLRHYCMGEFLHCMVTGARG